ncbi:MAG: magnesium transporter CorA family protein [Candidatus Gastranaerophilales bacterium]|nr:magnesium transporter CorA family protein [Candidatus Gastranaerophilales bacterium]
MIEILKTQDNGTLKELTLNDAESGSWFNLISPTFEEIQKVSIILDLEEDFIRNSLDADELSRIEFEDGNLLIITNVPILDDEKNFDTLPLGLIFTHEGVITVCSKENKILSSFNSDTSKFFDTRKKTNFMLNILFRTAKFYLRYLKIINKQTEELEDSLRKTTSNKALFKLIEAQKSLVYFTTALKDNRVVLEKILKSVNSQNMQGLLKFDEDDVDMLEDVIIETRQAEEMVEMHRNILENMMDGFASIINNNVNQVMKFLAAITIILSIPTMLGSFWGMNVELPFAGNSHGFAYVIALSTLCAVGAAVFFGKKGLL